MVQNTLGRLWMLNNPESPLKQEMEFYIEPDSADEEFLRVAGPEEITFCDPACGSGHILVYAFQLLTEMYRERGWRDRDIARSILERNLSGYEYRPARRADRPDGPVHGGAIVSTAAGSPAGSPPTCAF